MQQEFSQDVRAVIQSLDDLAHRRLYVKMPDGEFEKILGFGERDEDYICYCALLEKPRGLR